MDFLTPFSSEVWADPLRVRWKDLATYRDRKSLPDRHFGYGWKEPCSEKGEVPPPQSRNVPTSVPTPVTVGDQSCCGGQVLPSQGAALVRRRARDPEP